MIDHEGDTTSLPIQWETLKCVLRGLFRKHGVRLKKEKENRVSLLLKDISKLKKLHKQNLTSEDLVILTDKRIQFQTLLNEQTLRLRHKNCALYYQHGNKPGRLLATALHQRTPTASIVKIKTTSGETV